MISSRPTLYIDRSTRSERAGSWAWTAMAEPRSFERGDGMVPALTYPATPAFRDLLHAALEARRADSDTPVGERAAVVRLRDAYWDQLDVTRLLPGVLCAVRADGMPIEVRSQDTLFCTCSGAHAAQGACHRAWMVPALWSAGWNVVLDGVDLQARTDSNGRPRVSGSVLATNLLPWIAQAGCIVQVGSTALARRTNSGWEVVDSAEVSGAAPLQTSLFGVRP